jgi:hypothetical protein
MEAGRRLGTAITDVRLRTRVEHCAIALTLIIIFVTRNVSASVDALNAPGIEPDPVASELLLGEGVGLWSWRG